MKRLHKIIFVALASLIFASVIFVSAKFNKTTDKKLGYDGNTIVTSGGSSSSGGGGGGIGTITGPASSTDRALVIWSGILGVSTTNSNITLSSSTNDIVMPALGLVDGRDLSVDGAKLDLLPTSAYSLIGQNGTSLSAQSRLNLIFGSTMNASSTTNTTTNSTDVRFDVSQAIASSSTFETVTTTGNTNTLIGVSTTIPSGLVTIFRIRVVGRLTADDSSHVVYERQFSYTNATGTVTIGQNATPIADFEASSPTNLTAASLPAPSIASNTIRFNVQGVAATNMTWTMAKLVQYSF